MKIVQKYQKRSLNELQALGEALRKGGRPRSSIQDICDFCKKDIYILRRFISLRTKGYRFGCSECHKAGKFKWKSEGVDEKVMPECHIYNKPKSA